MSLRFVPPANLAPNAWEPLLSEEARLVARLWKGDPPDTTDVELAQRLLARSTGHSGCWYLALPEQTNFQRYTRRSAPYVGDARDADGCLVQAVLVLDAQGSPTELEVVRLDGRAIQFRLGDLVFSLVQE